MTEAAGALELREQGIAWVSRLLSGDATRADAAELAAWRARSPDHERAYRDAVRFLRTVEHAGAEYRQHAAAAEPAPLAVTRRGWMPGAALPVSRRWALGGGLAAVAALAVGLRSGVLTQQGDYRTGTGERRKLVLAHGLTVEMNTRTSLSVAQRGGMHDIQLFQGQAVVTAALGNAGKVTVHAGDGRSSTRTGKFDVRDRQGEGVCVTCIGGDVEIESAGEARRLGARQQLIYGSAGMSELVAIDPDVIASWEKGRLVFQSQPMREVIAEVNRYRSGRIVLMNEELGNRSVDAVFYLDHMADVVTQVEQLSGARVTRLPGDVVILS